MPVAGGNSPVNVASSGVGDTSALDKGAGESIVEESDQREIDITEERVQHIVVGVPEKNSSIEQNAPPPPNPQSVTAELPIPPAKPVYAFALLNGLGRASFSSEAVVDLPRSIRADFAHFGSVNSQTSDLILSDPVRVNDDWSFQQLASVNDRHVIPGTTDEFGYTAGFYLFGNYPVELFRDKHTGKYSELNDGSLRVNHSQFGNLPITGDGFSKGGQVIHSYGTRGFNAQIGGTLDGAKGTFLCNGNRNNRCISNFSGGNVKLTGNWRFEMSGDTVVDPPSSNSYFGWWAVNNAHDIEQYVAATSGYSGGNPLASTITNASSASYRGLAAGKAAYEDGDGNTATRLSGSFHADAEIVASFVTSSNKNVSGTIDNFIINGEEVDWSVELLGCQTTISYFLCDTTQTTKWTINGEVGNAMGTYHGTFYNQHTESNTTVPKQVVGGFDATFGAKGAEFGRMRGGFGATIVERSATLFTMLEN